MDDLTTSSFYRPNEKVDHTSIEGLLIGFTSTQLMDALAKRLFNGENSNISDYSLFNLWAILDNAITERGQQRFEQEAHLDSSMYYELADYEDYHAD